MSEQSVANGDRASIAYSDIDITGIGTSAGIVGGAGQHYNWHV